jgi:hypothetical protein
MPRYTCVPILIAISILAAACDYPNTPTEPSTTTVQTMGTGVTITAVSPTTVVRPGEFLGCPGGFSPFTVQFGLVVQSDNTTVLVSQFRVRFTDANGRSAQQVTLPAPVPTVQFGTALHQARQTFPLSFDLGCGFVRTGTAFVDVDGRGGSLVGTASVPVK